MSSDDTTIPTSNESDAGLASQQARDYRLRVERVAIKGLDKLSKRMGFVLGLMMGIIGLWIVYPFKGIHLTQPWWVFQLAQTEYFVDGRTLTFELRWVLPLVLGIIACYLSMRALSEANSERSRRGGKVALVGLLVSLAALAVLELNSFHVIDMGSSLRFPWMALFIYPVSFVGISAAMISLAISREASDRDESLSVLAALVPLALLLLPVLFTFHEPRLSDLVLAIYLWSGVSYFLSGMRLNTLYQGLTFDRLAKWAGLALAFVLILVGSITGGHRQYFVELRWIAAASAGLVLTLFAVWMIRKPNKASLPARHEGDQNELGWLMAVSGLIVSMALLALFILNASGALSLHAPEWFFPASILGVALAMISFAWLGSGSQWDKALSYCAVATSVVVLGVPLIRHGDSGLIGISLAALAAVVVLVRLSSSPTSLIPIKKLEKRRKLLDLLGMLGFVASVGLLILFVLGQASVVPLHTSYLAVSLTVAALTVLMLLLTRKAKFWEQMGTIGVVVAALLFASLSGLDHWDPAAQPQKIMYLYVASAFLLFLSGIHPISMYMGATVLREKAKLSIGRTWKVTRQVLKNPMGVIGTVILLFFVVLAAFGPELAPYNVPSAVGHPGIDQWEKYLQPSETLVPAPSYVVDIVWGLPLVAGLIAAVAALGIGSRASRSSTRTRSPLAGVALILSIGLLAIIILDALNVFELGKPEWLYPASAAGALLVILAAVSSEKSFGRKGFVGLGLIGGAAALVVLPVFMGSSPSVRATELFGTYLGAGALTIAAGLLLHSSIKESSGWIGGAVPASARMVKILGIGIAAAFILAGIVALLENNWTSHWMGTDNFGYDTFSELLYGARTSIIVGIFSAIIASVLGALVGLYSGYVGGWADEVIMRMNDVVLSIPWLVLMIIVAAMIGTIDLTGIILIIGLTGWSTTARMVRAQVLSIRERQYIERARAIGSPDLSIIRRHVLPNAFPLVFANTILTVAVSILSEATLSFLGMRPVGVVTWGTMLSFASGANAFAIGLHWWIMAPGLCIVVIVLGFTLLGYALDDVLNPKLRKR